MARRKPYHHGELREALVQAGLELLREDGLEGVTLRAAAARAGVSHAAPYHHFPSKAMLIEALAVESFGRFTRALQTAWEETPGPAVARFRALGITYVRFALENSEEFRLMNRPELRDLSGGAEVAEGEAPVEQAARRSYEVLLDGIRAGQAEGAIARGEPEPLALAAWSTVHGLSVLLIDGLLKGANTPEEGQDLAGLVTGVLGRGLLAR